MSIIKELGGLCLEWTVPRYSSFSKQSAVRSWARKRNSALFPRRSQIRMDISANVRPIFAYPRRCTVLAVSHQVVLMKDPDGPGRQYDYYLARIDEELLEDRQPRKAMIPLEDYINGDADDFFFVDNLTLCFLNETDDEKYSLVVLRANDELFQVGLTVRRYQIPLEAVAVLDMNLSNGSIMITTTTDERTWMEVWKFELPDSSSEQDSVVLQRSGRIEDPPQLYDLGSASECLIATAYFYEDPDYLGNEIYDIRSNKYHQISGAFPHYFHIARVMKDIVIFYKQERSTTYFSVVQVRGSGYEQVDYVLHHPSYIDGVGWSILHWTTDNRFFMESVRLGIVLECHLPGADVPLEDLAATTVWNNLPPARQSSVLKSRSICKRQILLQAIEED